MVYKILAVDDESINLRLMESFLDDEQYKIFSFESAKSALVFILDNQDIDVILLDRMMPDMNGLEFLESVKNIDELKNIPVIMQTAAAERSQVIEGIDAGVYYYLTKPYDDKVLISLVNAAISDFSEKKELSIDNQHYSKMLGFLQNGEFIFKTLEEARILSKYITTLFPSPDRVSLGISEMLINAVEHGNLGITYNEKTDLNNSGQWENEVIRRQSLDTNKGKNIIVNYTKNDTEIILRIEDEGKGFDWKEYLEISPSRATDNHGRGIAMSRLMSFDEIKYNNLGNVVECVVRL